jgi:hypothetical protein
VTEESRKATTIARACVALAAVAVVVFVIDLLEGPFFSLSTRMWAPERRGDRLIGGIEGAVKRADVSTGTVRVASGFLGLASFPVVITPQTQIVIKGKLGGFADLDRGQLVRVVYEVLSDRLVASRVEVLDRVALETVVPAQLEAEPAASGPPPRTKTSSSPASPPAEASASVSSTNASSPSSVPRWRAAPSVASPPSATPPPARRNASGAPSKRAVVAPSSSPRTQVQDPPRSAPVSTSGPVTPGARQAEDGGDAIDWLLKESATRGQ